jgi:hypothetical protein
MTNLDTFRGYPQLMKWNPDKTTAIADIVAVKIKIGDEFMHRGAINDKVYTQSGKVIEILEERKAKGTHTNNAKFYKVIIEGELRQYN